MAAPRQEQMAEAGAPNEPPPDWSWTESVAPPELYDPPQLKPDFVPRPLAFFCTQTSACCARPFVPCCCASAIRYICNSGAEDVDLSTPDEAIKKMLSNPNPKCPERMRGVWWMEGNQFNQETLVTFEDADWMDETQAVKNSYENWMRTPTCFGIVNATINYWKKGTMKLAMSPDKKWMTIDKYKVYILAPDDKLAWPDGTPVERDAADMMRIDFDNNDSSKPTYQYMVRRVAYLDSADNVVKTSYYDMLQDLVSKGKQRIEACPPQYCFCGSQADALQLVNPWAIVRYPARSK